MKENNEVKTLTSTMKERYKVVREYLTQGSDMGFRVWGRVVSGSALSMEN